MTNKLAAVENTQKPKPTGLSSPVTTVNSEYTEPAADG